MVAASLSPGLPGTGWTWCWLLHAQVTQGIAHCDGQLQGASIEREWHFHAGDATQVLVPHNGLAHREQHTRTVIGP